MIRIFVLLCGILITSSTLAQENPTVIFRPEPVEPPLHIATALDQKLFRYQVYRLDYTPTTFYNIVNSKQVKFILLPESGIPERTLQLVPSTPIRPTQPYNIPVDTALINNMGLKLASPEHTESMSLFAAKEIMFVNYTLGNDRLVFEPILVVIGAPAAGNYGTHYLLYRESDRVFPDSIMGVCGVGLENEDYMTLPTFAYPNPASRQGLHIRFYSYNFSAQVHTDIFDESGKKVYSAVQSPGTVGQAKVFVNTSAFPRSGMYFYSIRQSNRVHSGRFLLDL